MGALLAGRRARIVILSVVGLLAALGLTHGEDVAKGTDMESV